jgi:hypothetical protein
VKEKRGNDEVAKFCETIRVNASCFDSFLPYIALHLRKVSQASLLELDNREVQCNGSTVPQVLQKVPMLETASSGGSGLRWSAAPSRAEILL